MKRIVIESIGGAEAGVLDSISKAVAAVFNLKVPVGKGLPEPRHAYDSSRKQFQASAFLRELRAARKDEHDILLGVADADLFAPGVNFIFGEADIFAGVAVVALGRLRQEFYGYEAEAGILSERAVKEALHELGHVWGLDHCPDPKCVMFFSNSILDTDRKGSAYCGKCRETLGL